MTDRAIVVKDNFMAAAKRKKVISQDDMKLHCGAILVLIAKTKTKEICGGKLFCHGCPSREEAIALAISGIEQVIFTAEPSNPDETLAIQLLAERGLDTIYNPNLIF